MPEPKYKTRFYSSARCLSEDSYNKFLAKASLENLQPIIPAEIRNRADLIPFAANLFVANLANGNDDMMGTKEALSIYPQFAHTFCDIEHERRALIGHVVNAGVSKFDISKFHAGEVELITEDEVKDSKEPFNVCVAGCLYRVVAPEAIATIIDSSDPTSTDYLSISLSWEVGFNEYHLAVGSKLLSECEIIDDPELILKYTKKLRSEGGSGKLEDGRIVSRLLVNEVTPLGLGFTENPAAKVKGIWVDMSYWDKENDEENVSNAKIAELDKKNETESSHLENENVTKDINIIMSKKLFTNFEEIKSLNDGNAEQCSFANMSAIFSAEIEKVNTEWLKKVNEEKERAIEVQAQLEKSKSTLDTIQAELGRVKEDLRKEQEARATQVAEQLFNERMASFDSEYELTDADRQALATDIQGLDEAAFTKFKTKFAVYAQAKSREFIKSTKETVENPENKTAAALEAAASTVQTEVIPNTPSEPAKSLLENYKQAFSSKTVKLSK